MAGSNRKERRAAAKKDAKSSAKSSGTEFQPSTEIDEAGVDFLLKHPDRSGPKGKTLFELAEERQRELNKGNPAKANLDEDNTPPGERPFNDEDPIGPFGNAILYSVSLATLHLTLDVVVYSQYREDVIWSEILQRAGKVLPIFFVVVYLLRVEISMRFPTIRNLFFLVVSIAAGCYMIYSGNVNGYFYIMKTAPPIGALWVWSVVEMNLYYALVSVVAVVGYLWWNKFEAF
ncbi:hypothetical protein K469DRAFT_73043 [Zopfia rhizophila CBS 207.26]|uniref:DUF7719 domain-containing protein n=1 Tax=Zopfia rhizophila CBS 207.26 TaxID=1314779 RepID=A0A6A6ECZ8_9PEZI|nr:hypothetical protein K469DRAFT_73043 [Zopfia rhizophila CBS 207.26]